MADLNKIIDDLSKLTVVEAADLSKKLEEKWGVSATAPVAAAPAAGVTRDGAAANLDSPPVAKIQKAEEASESRIQALVKIEAIFQSRKSFVWIFSFPS